MTELIVFDCDGVLVDSEVIAVRIETRVMQREGFAIEAHEVADRYVGLSGPSMRKQVEEDFGRPLPEDFEAETQREALASFERELRPIAGIAETLRNLDHPMCVASSSDIDRIERSLSLTGLRDAFGAHLFSAQMVRRGKPAPDLFLHAAKCMDTPPEACVVIEDSRHGVEAARAAGMTVLGFAGGGHCGNEHASKLRSAGAHEVFDRMEELPERIRSLEPLVGRRAEPQRNGTGRR